MNFKIIAIEVFAILVSALLLNLPLVAATDINIIFNGVKQAETTYDTEDFVNREIDIIHEPNDILWQNVKVAVRVNSASLAKEIKKIYLYKCRTLSPADCVQSEPQVFENFINVELLWSDISEREGVSAYPQAANLLVMIKLEELDGSVSWTGLWNQIRRTAYNVFTEYSHELSEVDLHAISSEMVNPIKAYIESYGMIPFEWVTKAVFKDSSSLYALGADEDEMETSPPGFLTAGPRTNEINTINKDFYFIFPNTSSGVANPFTLNLNPTFECGDNLCEANLGETSGSCCYDCPCGSGQYCDVESGSTDGVCRNLNQVTLQAVSVSSPRITDCSGTFGVDINLRINNPPSSIPSGISPTFSLGGTVYQATCSGGPDYACSLTLNPEVDCGQGSYSIGPNDVTATITFNDGPNDISKTMSASVSNITVNYDCSCEDGFYCDIGTDTCESEDAITLGITSLTSYLDDYDEGDTIDLTARIFNPPTGLTVISTSATLNLTGGQVSPGSPTCTGPSTEYEYACSIPFQISGYSSSNSYTFNPNTLIFTITYQDGPDDKTKVLQTNFGPVSIPSQYCGDGVCNMGETSGSCCIDCDCSGPGEYCDRVSGCGSLGGVTVSVDSVSPVDFTDCEIPHIADIMLRVNNPPSTLTLDHYYHIKSNLPSGWNLECDESGYGGIFNCHLTIPAIQNCTLPYYSITGNALNLSISFDDGTTTSPFYSRIARQFSMGFSDLRITPVYHCGDGECESALGEDSSNCCMDCPCAEDEYCDATPSNPNGACRPKDSIRMVIDSPTQTVRFASCEIPNDVNIKAHIENQPSGMNPEYYYGELNGSSAELLHCNVEQFYEGSDMSFNCSLTVPPQFICEQGRTYSYRDNSFSIFISYSNGEITETKTLSADLPDIEVTQSIRSIYDIMQEAQVKMNESLYRIQETADKMFKAYKSCINWVKIATYIVVGIMVLGMVVGGIKAIGGKMDAYKFRQTYGTLGYLGGQLIQMLSNLCQLIAAVHKIDITVQSIEMNMLSMHMCMELNQHMLDIGQCRGREESCFNALLSCVNLGVVNNAMSSLNSDMQQINSITNQFGNSFSQFWFGAGGYSGAGNIFGGDRPSFILECNKGENIKNGIVCCSTKGPEGDNYNSQYGRCVEGKINFEHVSGYCPFPVVEINGNAYSEFRDRRTGSKPVSELLGNQNEITAKIDVYCYYDASEFANAVDKPSMKKDRYQKGFEITLKKGEAYQQGNPESCLCEGIIQTGENNPPQIVSFNPDKANAYPNEDIKFEFVMKDIDGDAINWVLKTGEANITGQETGCSNGCTVSKTHRYSQAGTYNVELIIDDTRGGTDRETTPVAIYWT